MGVAVNREGNVGKLFSKKVGGSPRAKKEGTMVRALTAQTGTYGIG